MTPFATAGCPTCSQLPCVQLVITTKLAPIGIANVLGGEPDVMYVR